MQKLELKQKQFEIPYSEELIKFLKASKITWWAIHSDEHPSGKRYIGVVI